jgi:hypothetical protein
MQLPVIIISFEPDFYGDETKQFCEFVIYDMVNL